MALISNNVDSDHVFYPQNGDMSNKVKPKHLKARFTIFACYMFPYHAPSFDDLASNFNSDKSGIVSPVFRRKKNY
jgi:hypothetical protein